MAIFFGTRTHRTKRDLSGKQLTTSCEDSEDNSAKRKNFTTDWAKEYQAGVTHAMHFLADVSLSTTNETRLSGLVPSGCLSLNLIKIQAVKSPNAPRKTMRTMPGTRPTTASDEGKESIPLLTISAIMRAATSSHDSVLYLIFGGGRVSQRLQIQRVQDLSKIEDPVDKVLISTWITNIMLLLMAKDIFIIIATFTPIQSVGTLQGMRFK